MWKGDKGQVLNHYQKPLSLMGKFVKAFTMPGDYIVDVTAGTCTTAVRTDPLILVAWHPATANLHWP